MEIKSDLIYYANMLQPNIICQGTADVDNTWDFDNRISPFHRLYYILDGEAEIYNDFQKVTLIPNHLYFIPSGVPFSYRCNSKMIHVFFHFNLPILTGTDFFENIHKIIELDYSEDKIFELKNALKEENFQSVFKLKTIIDESLYMIVKSFNTDFFNSLNIRGLLLQKQAADYIEENLSSKLRIEDIAAALEITPSKLCRNFKRDVNIGIKDYICIQLMKKAKQLLSSTPFLISEIAEMLGFNDQYYFSRFFSKYENASPREFRKLYQTK